MMIFLTFFSDTETGMPSKCTRYKSSFSEETHMISIDRSEVEKCHNDRISVEFDLPPGEETIGTEVFLMMDPL